MSQKPLKFNKCVQNGHHKATAPLFSVSSLIIEPQNLTITLLSHPFLFISCEFIYLFPSSLL